MLESREFLGSVPSPERSFCRFLQPEESPQSRRLKQRNLAAQVPARVRRAICSRRAAPTEGFNDVMYVSRRGPEIYRHWRLGEVDISVTFVAPFILEVDAGNRSFSWRRARRCLELFGTGSVRSLRDLRKNVAISRGWEPPDTSSSQVC